MPFKSEAQRKYLWANEPGIARDWTDKHGSGIAKALGGRIGYQMGNMVGGEMEGAMMQSKEVIKELYDAFIAQGLSPQEAIEKIKEIIASTQTQEAESPMMGEEFGRAPAAFGGMMDTYTGRRKYGLGSLNPFKLVKKAVKKVKELASSKFGKIALGYLATAGISNYLAGAQGTFGLGAGKGQLWKDLKWLDPRNVGTNISTSWGKLPFNQAAKAPQLLPMARPEGKALTDALALQKRGIMEAAMEKDAISVLGKKALEEASPTNILGIPNISNKALAGIALPSIAAYGYTAAQPPETLGGEVTAEYDDNKAWWDNYLANLPSDYSVNPDRLKSAQGGRIGRQEGGLMDLGGRIGYADGLTVAEKGPLYIDPDTDLPLHNIEKEFQQMSREERIKKYYEMLARIESYKDIEELNMPGHRFEDMLHWGAMGGGGGSGNPEMTEALEYTDHPAAEALYERGEHYNRGGRIGYLAGGPLIKKGITEVLKKFKRPIFSFDDEAKMIMDLTETGKYTEKELIALEGDQLVEIYVREGFTSPKAIPDAPETINLKNITPKIEKAYGGRVAAQEGGLMNLGGMEKDYRQEGGFVPIGGEEKADDVPARLSKNEFVFTADAVRAAGGGDIDAGAEVMENVMQNLEAGGKISEESQGEGAQGMFETSERLSEVI